MIVAAVGAEGEALEEVGGDVLVLNDEGSAVDLATGEDVELRGLGVQGGDGAAAEFCEGEVGVGEGDPTGAVAGGKVGEVVEGKVVVTRVGIGVGAALGGEFVEVNGADFLGAEGGGGEGEAETPVA